jgi:hypothetical protein
MKWKVEVFVNGEWRAVLYSENREDAERKAKAISAVWPTRVRKELKSISQPQNFLIGALGVKPGAPSGRDEYG